MVEKGILRSFLHNTSSAAREDRGSTGNALRPSSGDTASKYLGEPVVHHTNLMIGEGTETFESILSSVKDGMYLRHIIGAHTANRITGEFSVAPLVAYKIEKGQIIHPVREAMIGCNIQDFLKNVIGVGVHWKQCEGAYFDTAIVSPILKIEKVSVSA
jgi:PmbA protein